MKNLWYDILNFISRMDSQDWLLTMVVVIAIGAVCMRGYGSRANY